MDALDRSHGGDVWDDLLRKLQDTSIIISISLI
jgi:hypothetical protein